MVTYIQYLKDTLSNNFLGVQIFPTQVNPYLDKLKSILGDEFDVYTKNQQNGDGGQYYIELIGVYEYDRLVDGLGMDNFINSLDVVFKYPIDDIKFLGLGKAESDSNKSYHIVIQSDKLEEIRNKYGLDKKDFHITLGFKWRDVYGVRKNKVLSDSSDFLRLLSDSYYKNDETFEFIKSIDNFNGDSELEIESIKIEKTSAVFRIGRNIYFTVAIVDDKFRIVAEWYGKSDTPILSHTLVKRKFKEI